MMSQQSKTKLSRGLLDMKFMKKSKEKVEREKEEETRKALYEHELSENMRRAGLKYVMEGSYVRCENLVFGRMAFKGFNPEIEKMMRGAAEAKEPVDRKMETSVTDEEMAESYAHLVGTMSKKFARKRKLSKKGDAEGSKAFKRPLTDA